MIFTDSSLGAEGGELAFGRKICRRGITECSPGLAATAAATAAAAAVYCVRECAWGVQVGLQT